MSNATYGIFNLNVIEIMKLLAKNDRQGNKKNVNQILKVIVGAKDYLKNLYGNENQQDLEEAIKGHDIDHEVNHEDEDHGNGNITEEEEFNNNDVFVKQK
jgi:hypothetical protein